MSTTTWNFDLGHSDIGFSVRHLMVSKVRGHFKEWGGTLELDDAHIENSKVNVHIQSASVETKDGKRDDHLRSADFFDVTAFPQLTFESTKITKKGGDDLEVDGNLTIHGVTKLVKLEVELSGEVRDPWGGTRRGFSAKGHINRKDFGLAWNAALETGGVVVGEKVEIHLEIEVIKAA
ncbi:MAG TPA: YceI family protein [Kofleriaceae bacterium]|jgi:polyisoprenoid-binding protein YceI